jgi:hypothetical protein
VLDQLRLLDLSLLSLLLDLSRPSLLLDLSLL